MNNLLITTVQVSFEDSERDDAYDRIDHFLRNNLDDGNYSVYSDFLEKVYGNSSAELEKQLAASQAYAEQLRVAIDRVRSGAAALGLDRIFDIATEALSQPSDTSALDAYVAEKVKEAGKFDIWKTNPYTKVLETSIEQLTKQRDLAVEALTRAIDMVGHPDNITYLQQTLEAIKESEAK